MLQTQLSKDFLQFIVDDMSLILVHSHDGPPVQCRALLDTATLASFVTERLTQRLNLPRAPRSVRIGI